MYEKYWQLNCTPFGESTHPDRFFPARSHRNCINRLAYVIKEGKGAALLVGPSGVGKTMALNRLLASVSDDHTRVARIMNPQLRGGEFFLTMARGFGVETATTDTAILYELLQKQFVAWIDEQVRPLLVVEDAHLIAGRRELNLLESLLPMQRDGQPVLTMILCGSPYLSRRVRTVRNMGERLSLCAAVEPLHADEVRPYVDFLMQFAGGLGSVFTEGAIAALAEYSSGLPRRINRLAELALVAGAAYEVPQVDEKLIRSVSKELMAVAA